MNNHSVVFLLLNCHIPWKSDYFPDVQSLDTDQLLILFDWRLAADQTRGRTQDGGRVVWRWLQLMSTWGHNNNMGTQPERMFTKFSTESQPEAQFPEKKMLPEGFRTTCFLLSGSSDLEWNKASGVFIQAIKVLRCLCNLFFIPNGPRIADANVSLQYCYLTMSH